MNAGLKLERQEGDMPTGWDRVAIDEVCTIGGGKTPRKGNEAYWDGSIPWVSPKDFDGVALDKTEDNLTQQGVAENSINLYEAGDIAIVVRSGVLRHSLPVAQLQSEMAVNQDLKVLQPDATKITSDYLLNILLYEADRIRASCVKTGTTVESVETAFLKAYKLPLPPIPEQHRIADILSTVDKQIQQTDEIIGAMKELKRGITSELLKKGISRTEYQTAHFGPMEIEIPVKWDVETLKHVTEDITDGVHSTPDYVEDGIPFLSTKNVNPFRREFDTSSYEKYISKEDHEEMTSKIKPEKGDLIIARRATIGPTQLVRVDSEFSIFVGLGLIKPTKQIDGEFMEQFLNWDKIQSVLNLKSPGSTMKTLNLNTLRNQIVPIPPLSEQQKIAGVLRNMDNKIQKEQESKQRLQELKRGLMQDLLTGKIRIDTD